MLYLHAVNTTFDSDLLSTAEGKCYVLDANQTDVLF